MTSYPDQDWLYDQTAHAQPIGQPVEYRQTLGRIVNGLIGEGFTLTFLSEVRTDADADERTPAPEPDSWEHFTSVAPPWPTRISALAGNYHETAEYSSIGPSTAICRRAAASTVVEVIRSYSNPNPQLDEVLDGLAAPSAPLRSEPGPSWHPLPDRHPSLEDAPPTVQPHALNRRLTTEQRRAIVIAFSSGTQQKELAATYGISIRSVRRLVRHARDTGLIV